MTETIKIGNKRNRIFCISNGKYYNSSREAAADLDINATTISKHLRGERQHVSGYVFVRAPEMLTAEKIQQLRNELKRNAENLTEV